VLENSVSNVHPSLGEAIRTEQPQESHSFGYLELLRFVVEPRARARFLQRLEHILPLAQAHTRGLTRMRIMRRSVLERAVGPIFLVVEHRDRFALERFSAAHLLPKLMPESAFPPGSLRLQDAELLVRVDP
jgi:hypothetical protein